MENRVTKLGKQWVLAFALAAGSLSAHATLLGRDIHGNPVAANDPSAVFEYDTYLNITWLRDWNHAQTSGFDADGRMTWYSAVAWASGLTVGAFSGWRLPSADTDCTGYYNCTSSEMGHVWYTELGNTANSLTNTDPFENLQTNTFWSGTEYAPNTGLAWGFSTYVGTQDRYDKGVGLYAVAVRPGDVAATQVPEPEGLAIVLAGLVALSASRRATKLGKQWVLAFALAAGSLSAHATLLGRDINGNPVAANDPSAVFEYDTYLNITWLRDWNYAQTSGFDADGRMDWYSAVAWASGLTVGSFSGWRLPTGCEGYTCADSEMVPMWYTELGNPQGRLMNTGPFENLQSNGYWSGTQYFLDQGQAWYFFNGNHDNYYKSAELYAVAVRPGDVAATQVPEPGGLAIVLAGLMALSAARRCPRAREDALSGRRAPT